MVYPDIWQSNGDLKPKIFPNTYLNDVSDSSIYEFSTEEQFFKMKVGEIACLHLPGYFASHIDYKIQNKDLRSFWSNLAELCQKSIPHKPLLDESLSSKVFPPLVSQKSYPYESLPLQIATTYKYLSIIELVDGFPMIKGYLRCTLSRNDFLWKQFVSVCMGDAAKNVSGPEGEPTSEMDIISKLKPSGQERRHGLEYMREVKNSLEKQDWPKNLKDYFEINVKFLDMINMVLKNGGFIDREGIIGSK